MPVFDALNARSERTLNGGGRIGVHRDVSIAIGGRLHAGAKLGLAERQHVQVVRGDDTPPPPTSFI